MSCIHLSVITNNFWKKLNHVYFMKRMGNSKGRAVFKHCIATYTVQRHTLYSDIHCIATYTVQRHTLYSDIHCIATFTVQRHSLYSDIHCTASYTVQRHSLLWLQRHFALQYASPKSAGNTLTKCDPNLNIFIELHYRSIQALS